MGRDDIYNCWPGAWVVTVSRPVSGVLWQRLALPVAIHLRGLPGGHSSRNGRAARAPCSALLQVGVAEPSGSPRTLVRSYRTVSPSPVLVAQPSAVCSLLP